VPPEAQKLHTSAFNWNWKYLLLTVHLFLWGCAAVPINIKNGMSHNGHNIDKIMLLSWMTGVCEMCLSVPDYPENIDWIKSCFCGTSDLVNKAISSALGPAIHLPCSAPQCVFLSFPDFIHTVHCSGKDVIIMCIDWNPKGFKHFWLTSMLKTAVCYHN